MVNTPKPPLSQRHSRQSPMASKNRVKDAVKFLADFERVVAEEARRHGADGVVCGHLHRPAIENIDGVDYYNTGDWVERCTALVEHLDGTMEILHWPAATNAETGVSPENGHTTAPNTNLTRINLKAPEATAKMTSS